LWKERNRRIFLDKINTTEKVWKGIQNAIRETVLAEIWEEDDWKTDPAEESILRKLNMNYSMIYPNKGKRKQTQKQSPDQFRYPR